MCLEIEYTLSPRRIYTYILTIKNRIVMSTMMIIGWVALIASWIVPQFIKDKETKHFIGACISAFATGIFTGELIYHFIK